ncbi:MAG: hypothetical protein ABIR24_04325 [Verrucomicrobiota bacterium]
MKINNQLFKCLLVLLAFSNVVFAQQPEASKIAVSAPIKEWIAQLNDGDYSKRNAAVLALSSQPNDALPLLHEELKTETNSNKRWWLQVAIRECDEKRPKSGEISATPDNSKGLRPFESYKGGEGEFLVIEREDVRCWTVPKSASYLYLIASDKFRQKVYANLEIQVEFLDIGTSPISLEYNSTNLKAPFNGAYEMHPKHLHRTNSGQWRKSAFHLSEAHFRGAQNQNTDFRFYNGGEELIIRSVRVWPSNPED